MTLGYNQPLYILPFDHRGSFQTGMFGWKGSLSPEQTAQIAAAKQVIYDSLKAAVAAGVPKDCAGILVDEQFGAAILRDAARSGYITCAPAVLHTITAHGDPLPSQVITERMLRFIVDRSADEQRQEICRILTEGCPITDSPI
jgi:hypothetical protein